MHISDDNVGIVKWIPLDVPGETGEGSNYAVFIANGGGGLSVGSTNDESQGPHHGVLNLCGESQCGAWRHGSTI